MSARRGDEEESQGEDALTEILSFVLTVTGVAVDHARHEAAFERIVKRSP